MYSLWDGLWTSAFRVGHSDVEVTRYPECAHSFLRWQSTSRTRSSRLYVLHVPSRTHISIFITNCIHRIARSMFNVVRNVLIVTFLVYFTFVRSLCNETTAKTYPQSANLYEISTSPTLISCRLHSLLFLRPLLLSYSTFFFSRFSLTRFSNHLLTAIICAVDLHISSLQASTPSPSSPHGNQATVHACNTRLWARTSSLFTTYYCSAFLYFLFLHVYSSRFFYISLSCSRPL